MEEEKAESQQMLWSKVTFNTSENLDWREKPQNLSVSLTACVMVCDGEREFVHQRKKKVLESLKKLGVNCTEDSVPHIALLGSGGGQRAAVGLLGSLCQMGENQLLDFVLYLGGISGSTWSMAYLYTDPEWSRKTGEAINKLMNSKVDVDKALSWLTKRSEDEDFSLSDIWGLVTTAGVMKQMGRGHLSDGANKNPNNPYPIYCAIEKNCFNDELIKGQWFEGSPHETGFPELGLFVETHHLGSKFQSGERVEEVPEMDMVKLQGILGSALASKRMTIEYILNWLHVPEIVEAVDKVYLHAYNTLISLFENHINEPTALSQQDDLHPLLAHIEKAHQEEQQPEHESNSDEEMNIMNLEWRSSWIQDVKTRYQNVKRMYTFVTSQVIPLIAKWEWGTTNNFLYKHKDSSVPEKLTSTENINLIDAGLLMNLPFLSFLGDKRDIDLIIALEYSAGEMFETLTVARKYADDLKKPFPEIDPKILEEKNFPKDCYVIEGKGKEPTIVYLPLFNQRNCKTQEEYDEKMEKFTTFQRPYDKEQTEELLKTAKGNISNNSALLLEEIQKAADRRQKKQGKSVVQKFSDSCLFGLV